MYFATVLLCEDIVKDVLQSTLKFENCTCQKAALMKHTSGLEEASKSRGLRYLTAAISEFFIIYKRRQSKHITDDDLRSPILWSFSR